MKFWKSPWFNTVLHIIGIAGTTVVPILAATGIGIPAAVVAGAAAAGGIAAKLSQSPITPQTVNEAVDSVVKR